MSQFRFYIVDTGNGTILGTQDETPAEDFARCEDYYVIDTQKGKWLNSGGRYVDIEVAKDSRWT